MVVVNGEAGSLQGVRMSLEAQDAVSLLDPRERRPLRTFAGQAVHAVAAIGNPARFFETLRAHGLQPIEHPLPDHAALRREDVEFGDERAVLMTEKDAVKCAALAGAQHWFVPVDARLAQASGDALLERICAL